MTAILAVEHAAALTFVCAVLFSAGCGAQGISSNPRSNSVNARICGENQFTCQNGECIQSELLCDGRADCSDQSDETTMECSKPELTCPDYAFRCNYGACVNGDATCNGVKDCIDNSDELLPRCPGVSSFAESEEGCGLDAFRCKNGQCVNATSLCDGTADCADGSDETFMACGSFPCSQIYFRCNYGACIDGDLSCNGVNNCADGSDEDPQLCHKPGPTPPTHVTIPIPTPTPTPTPTGPVLPTPTPATDRSCIAPPQPPNGQWKLHRDQCKTGVDCEVPEAVPLSPGSQLVYNCRPSFKARGTTEVYCGFNGKWSRIPVCIEIKCNSLNTVSTEATCTRDGRWLSCDPAVLPGTRAELNCRNGYRQDTTDITSRRKNVVCNAGGKWEPDPIRCIPVCGKTATKGTPFIYNGLVANITDFPWHATLYIEENGEKKFSCGGTIIQTNLILTAAHCVFDEVTRNTIEPRKLFVATGNTFRDYDSPLHDSRVVRQARVKKIHRHCQFYGFSGNYGSDIAILELNEPFEFSGILLPACLDVNDYSDLVLENGSIGRVAGFGRNELGDTSGLLQTIRVPYVSYSECTRSNVATENKIYVSADKFCAGYSNGTSVCDGDSGGGLVFEKNDLWYVMGIVSVGLGVTITDGERRCDNTQYSLYTRVDKYMAWIQDIIFNLERYGSVQPCGPRPVPNANSNSRSGRGVNYRARNN